MRTQAVGIEGKKEVESRIDTAAKAIGNKRKAWHRRMLVIIKSHRENGDIKLTASSAGLSEAKIKSRLRSLSLDFRYSR